ncbi:MAG: CsgG/HfaB family protein [Terasakiella sp.]|uniref:CsgG/HfaB family protein n=1 Tax=unclassified Terasakiella TaxID=2614952 RepID=UPI003AFFDBD8
MNRLFIYTFTIFTLFSSVSEAKSWWEKFLPGSTEPPTIAIISDGDFIPDTTGAESKTRKGLPDVLAERIVERLASSKRFVVSERQALRRVIMEQRFEEKQGKGYLDRALDKAISSMDKLENTGVLGVTAAASAYNDNIKDFQDLGRAVKADYLLIGNLEKMKKGLKSKKVPYSTMGRKSLKATVDARLRLRVIDTEKGTVLGATSTRVKLSENLFSGRGNGNDGFTAYDHIARIAAAKVLDAIYPAAVADVEPFVITRGGNEGVQIDDTFEIKRPGKMIKDPSGVELGRVLSKVGLVKVTQLQDAISVVKVISGRQPQKGDVAIYEVDEMPSVVAKNDNSSKKATSVTNVNVGGERPRVAVGLIKVGTTASRFEEASFNNFTDTLISRLNQTKRFQVADRQEMDQLLDEQTLEAMSSNSDLSSAVGNIQAVDYLVIGSVSSLNVKSERSTYVSKKRNAAQSKMIAMMGKDTSGSVQGNMRIVDARTGDILVSRKVAVGVDLDEGASNQEIIVELSDAYSEKVVSELMRALFPIKVAAVGGDGTVYVNRGNDGGLIVGEKLKAYRAGQPITDPDTGVVLGVEETFVGDVILSEVEDARSKGTLVSNGSLQSGDILKRDVKRTQMNTKVAAAKPQRSGNEIGSKPVKGKKYSLAIGGITVDSGLKIGIQPHRLSYRLTDNLVSGLTQAKRFKIMERKGLDEIMSEKGFESFVNGGKLKSRFRELEGADYLVMGDVTAFKSTIKTKAVPYVDNVYQVSHKGYGEGTLRIVDVHTGAIVASEQIIVNPTMMDEVTGKRPQDWDEDFTFLINKFSEATVQSVVNNLFPIKVLGVSGDEHVFINRGRDGRVNEGQIFNIMRPGEEMIDEDTGLSFGKTESKIAQIEIVSVERARSKGIIIGGDFPEKGDIVRLSKTEAMKQGGVKVKKQPAKIRQPNW